MEPVCVGLIGAGDISPVYLNALTRSSLLDLMSVATRNLSSASQIAQAHGARGASVQDMLADPAIELVINLTPGVAHQEINAAAIEAGKHVYSEKPFALTHNAAADLAAAAERRNILIGSAPDTFYGSAHQAARRAIDEGLLGKIVFGTSLLGLPGLEYFHPNPAAFYRPGGEPPFDAGPYYITMWINLLGPVRRVYATSGAGQKERTIRRGPLAGTTFAVEVDSTFNTILEFDDASVNFIISLDSALPTQRAGEVYGSEGVMFLSDPMFFSGTPELVRSPQDRTKLETAGLAFSAPNRVDHIGRPVADYRGVGMTDLALAIRTGSQHRTGPDFIVHAVDVMEAIAISARERRAVDLVSTCNRPKPLDPVEDASLIALTPSPFDLEAASGAHSSHLLD